MNRRTRRLQLKKWVKKVEQEKRIAARRSKLSATEILDKYPTLKLEQPK